ncbi:Armadillo repeat-containing protein 7 [Lamellibrachia satsuma]|nr:Armadillo repeat-containing protein 7 [Lamellibrachia satsuma]
MFSTREQLERKTGPYGIGRQSYLQSLVTEFQDTDSDDAKEQVLANLANFAYDPINYECMQQLNVIDLFLDSLNDSNGKLVDFAVGGLCNVCLDRENKAYILKNNGVSLMKNALSSTNEETVLSAITCLMFLVTPQSKSEITSLPIIDAMMRFSSSNNTRLSNLATVFLQIAISNNKFQMASGQGSHWLIESPTIFSFTLLALTQGVGSGGDRREGVTTECDGGDRKEELFCSSDRGGEEESEGVCGGFDS